jgi:hypothetical protein
MRLVILRLRLLQMLIALLAFVACDCQTFAQTVAVQKDPPAPTWIVTTTPKIGATDVDPKVTEITVTFDRDMGTGMSWTGEEALMGADPAKKASWKDKRTCVLPVKLKRGQYYRVGINSTSFRNFRSAAGEAAPCGAIYFVTQGATPAIQSRVRVPRIVKMVPVNGADDVNPNVQSLRVTFDILMGDGMSWTGSGENFPQSPAGAEAKWSNDRKSCLLPVALEPNHKYVIGINSSSHINFQSKWGVPMVPVKYEFTTKAAE